MLRAHAKTISLINPLRYYCVYYTEEKTGTGMLSLLLSSWSYREAGIGFQSQTVVELVR